jgi:hypothetical protein
MAIRKIFLAATNWHKADGKLYNGVPVTVKNNQPVTNYMQEGISGKIARSFITSKLTILLMVAFLLIGGYSTLLIPREEEPQIEVPMADIFIGFPGASPKEVETKTVLTNKFIGCNGSCRQKQDGEGGFPSLSTS